MPLRGFDHNSIILRTATDESSTSPQYRLKARRSHWAAGWFGLIQSQPWLLDWTHWLKENFNDLLSQVLIRCRQTALCGTGQGWGPERTELAGLLPLAWVKGWTAHSADAPLDKFPSGAQSVHRGDIIFSSPRSAMTQMFSCLFLTRSFSLTLSSLLQFYHPVNYLGMRETGLRYKNGSLCMLPMRSHFI